MTEEELRVREEALLNEEEIAKIYADRHWICFMPDINRSRVVAQAQVDKLLRDKRIRIIADNQIFPSFFYEYSGLHKGDYEIKVGIFEAGFVKCERKEK